MKLAVKIPKYCLGLFFLAVGVTFSIKSNLGISPVNSIGYVLSLVLGINQGKVITRGVQSSIRSSSGGAQKELQTGLPSSDSIFYCLRVFRELQQLDTVISIS